VIGQDPWTGEGVTSKADRGALRPSARSDVTVNINSPGGDFFEGIAIYSLLREHPHNVTVKVMGLAASAASIIAMAGDKIEISDIGFLMVHNAWALAVGNRHDMREAADTLEPFDDAMAGLYAARAGVDQGGSRRVDGQGDVVQRQSGHRGRDCRCAAALDRT
jgi:ATP-dependent Clp protease protease subunit